MRVRREDTTHFFLYALKFFAKLGIVALELLHSPEFGSDAIYRERARSALCNVRCCLFLLCFDDLSPCHGVVVVNRAAHPCE